MARPLRIEYPGAFYHVTSRGNEQKDVFKSRADREKFLSYLESATLRYSAIIHAYCLMRKGIKDEFKKPKKSCCTSWAPACGDIGRKVALPPNLEKNRNG